MSNIDGSIILLFYSKYSNICKNIIKLISPHLEFRKICVDHPDIRNIILDEKDKYNIREVPCILIFHSNGIMNKYEGEKALEWVDLYLKNNNKMETIKKTFIQNISSNNILENISSNNTDSNENISSNNVNNNSENISSNMDSNENIIENLSMKRQIDTTPLIQNNDNNIDSNRRDCNNNEKRILDKKNDSIMNIAQQLQSQREKEDEMKNPNAISKINNV